MKRLVAVGSWLDLHIQLVSEALERRGHELRVFDPLSAVTCAEFSDGRWLRFVEAATRAGNRARVMLDQRALVWWRNKRFYPAINTPKDQEEYYATAERLAFMRGNANAASGVEQVSPWQNIVRAEDKLYQLPLAHASGLLVPETLCSTDPEALSGFLAAPVDRIVKPLSIGHIPAPRLGGGEMIQILTNVVDEEDRLSLASFEAAPTLLQTNIRKQFEVRVVATVLSSVAFRASSPVSEGGATDWRRDIRKLEWTRIETPDDVTRAIHRYLAGAGLAYGVFDFIVDEDGYWLFLECNPDGQWAWIEPDSEGGIAVAMAELLGSRIEGG